MSADAVPLVCLLATDPGAVEPLKVLAAELAETRLAPATVLLRPADLALPERWPAAALIVIAGEVLPAEVIETAKTRRIGLFWVDAGPVPRLDRRIVLPWRLKRCLAALDEVHARDRPTAQSLLRRLPTGATVAPTGPLARHPSAVPCNESELDALRAALGGRPVWFAFSLPGAEFDAVLAAQAEALRLAQSLVLIAAPRDPRDGAELAARATAAGFETARRLAEDDILATTQVYVADAEDEPGLYLRLAPVTYLGGSMTPGTGAPPAAPAAALGTALIFGREAERGFLDQLHAVGGARRIQRPADLGAALAGLLAPEAGAAAALQAWTLATQGSEATFAVARAICDWLALNARPGATA